MGGYCGRMENNSLEFILNENTGGKYGFRFKSAKLDKATGICHVEMFYNDGVILSQQDRLKAEEIARENLPKNFNYQVKFIKNFVVNEALIENLKAYMHNSFPSILYEIVEVDCEQENKKVVLSVNERIMEYVNARNVKKETEQHLQDSFYAHIEVVFDVKKENVEKVVEEKVFADTFDIIPDVRFIEVSNVEPVVGELTETNAFYIKDKKTPDEDVVFCGKMLYLKEYSYTPKRKSKEGEEDKEKQETKATAEVVKENQEENKTEEQEEKIAPKEKKLYKFVLEDFTGKVPCVIFATKNNSEQLAKLEGNMPYIVSGKLEEDKYSGGVSMRVKNISKCTLPEVFEEEIHFYFV